MIAHPWIRSGQPEASRAVIKGIAIIAKLTNTSLRADRHAALLSEPPSWRTRATSHALGTPGGHQRDHDHREPRDGESWSHSDECEHRSSK